MVSAKRRSRSKKPPAAVCTDSQQKDQETIRLINEALEKDPVDKTFLRKLAVVRGLVNNTVRKKVWPQLLSIDSEKAREGEYGIWRTGKHRDSSVVVCDIQRSLWSFTEGWSDEDRAAKRAELQAVLTAVICEHGRDVFYYQGLHDIAAVLLFNTGEKTAFRILSCMAVCQLRDCTRRSLDPVLELLQLLMPLLAQCDSELHQHIEESGIPPYFALSWYITWFSHNVPQLEKISRIFDALLASHPLMPLYLSATVMQSSREAILEQKDASELHRTLTNLTILGAKPIDTLLIEAYRLFKDASCAEARLEGDRWILPEKTPSKPGVMPRDALSWLHMQNKDDLKKPKLLKLATQRAAIGGLVFLSSLAALYASRALQ